MRWAEGVRILHGTHMRLEQISYIFWKPPVLYMVYSSEKRVVWNSKVHFLVLLHNQTLCNQILQLSHRKNNLYLQIFLLVSILHLRDFWLSINLAFEFYRSWWLIENNHNSRQESENHYYQNLVVKICVLIEHEKFQSLWKILSKKQCVTALFPINPFFLYKTVL